MPNAQNARSGPHNRPASRPGYARRTADRERLRRGSQSPSVTEAWPLLGSTDDRRLPMSRMLLRVPGGLRRGSPAHPRVTLGVQRLREDRTSPACCGPVVGSGISGEVDMDGGHGRDPAGPGQLPGRDGGAYTDTGAPWPGPAGRRTGRETAGASLWSQRSSAWRQSRRGSSSPAPGARAACRPGTAGRRNRGRRQVTGEHARALRRDRHNVRAPVRTGTGIRSARAAGRTWPG